MDLMLRISRWAAANESDRMLSSCTDCGGLIPQSATYPRFLTLPVRSDSSASLLLEFRTGMAGLGDTKMYVYGGKPGQAGTYRWESRGVILKGVECNA